MDELDKKADEAHNGESDGGGESNLLEFYSKSNKKKKANKWVSLRKAIQKKKVKFQFWDGGYLCDRAWCTFWLGDTSPWRIACPAQRICLFGP